MALQNTVLADGWLWKERDPAVGAVLDELADERRAAWRAAARVPSEVHVELLRAGRIPDPHVGANEHEVQWVGEREWLYATAFAFEHPHPAGLAHAQLVFEGLDTLCTVYLNGFQILKADNMFTPYTVQLDPDALLPARNTLLLHFASAPRTAAAREARHGRARAGSCHRGDASRVYVRKAQYAWRWDWGPELLTAGPWRPVVLRRYAAALARVHVRAAAASLALDVAVAGDAARAAVVAAVLRAPGGAVVRSARRAGGAGERADVVRWTFAAGEVQLWWPAGHGAQALYDVEVALEDADGRVFDRVTKRIGFRHVALVQEPLAAADQYGTGTTFLFEVNGQRIFIGGSNWVPADNFLTTVSPARYRAWLELLRDGNQNMVRVWGGGVYEADVFYDICDELGILVWQDFQFACGVYPAHELFVASVRREAEANVVRLRHHPCLALFCGNSEDYQQVLQWGIDELPARVIYEEVLPEIVARLTSPAVPYWRGSPYGGQGWDTGDPTVGDIHQWDVWGGAQRPYQDYDVLGGRFVSEFGLPAVPDMRTVEHWLAGAPAAERAKLMAQHTRAGLHERRFAILMGENFEMTEDFERYCYLTQVMQAEGVGHAFRSWRREWRGRGREYCGGALVWQLNDCWPGTSWAIADYFLRPKAAYYTIARELAPYTVGIARTVEQNRESDRPRQFYEFGAFRSRGARIEVWGTNATPRARRATLELRCFDLASPWTHCETHAVELAANGATELLAMPVPHAGDAGPTAVTASSTVVVAARLLDDDGAVLARHADWPQPYRLLELPAAGLRIEVDGDVVHVAAERPAKAVMLRAAGAAAVRWADNNLDVVPGDPRAIPAQGLAGRAVHAVLMT